MALFPENGLANDQATSIHTHKVALVRRGECNFTEKCLRAQARGAVAVVVYDSQERERCVLGSWSGLATPRLI